MVISQILLVAIVGHWLRSQFNREKELLEQKLTSIYLTTQDNIIDTILFRTIVRPVIGLAGDTSSKKLVFSGENVSLNAIPDTSNGKTGGIINLNGHKSTVTIRMSAGPDSINHLPDTFRIRKINNDYLLRSVKMIVAHRSDTTGPGGPVTTSIMIKPDTAMFLQNFGKVVSGSGMNFNINWQQAKDTLKSGLPKIIINPGTNFSIPGVSVKKYTGYLLGNIAPQIIFGFILVVLTAISFIISWRSIKSQALLNTLRNEFIGNITHELKTPVATLSVVLESLGRYNLRNDQSRTDEYLQLASIETKRLEELINKILDHSRIDSEAEILNISEVDINKLVTDTAEGIKQKPGFEGTIVVSTPVEKTFIQGDRLLLTGVLINLLDNSIKYCNKKPEISISAEATDKEAVIIVNDNGPGIPDEFHQKIFDKFFRVPSGNIHNVKGYGLGLTFAHQVVRLHRGTIRVKNLREGCSFIIRLPRK